MTYEEAKQTYFPLLSTEQAITIKVGDIISMIVNVTTETPIEPMPEFLDEAVENYIGAVYSTSQCAELVKNGMNTMGDLLIKGSACVLKTRRVGRKTYWKLQELYKAHGYSL